MSAFDQTPPPDEFRHDQEPFYQHSGGAPLWGLLLTLMLGLVNALVLALAYTFFQKYCPIVHLSALATVFFGLGMGVMVSLAAKQGKVRSRAAFVTITVLVTLFGIYAEWGFFPAVYSNNLGSLFYGFRPGVMVEVANHLYYHGSWGFTEFVPVRGVTLVVYWIGEAGILMACSVLTALGTCRMREPFCESCNRWTKVVCGINSFVATGLEPVWERLNEGDLQAIADLPRREHEEPSYVRLDLAFCRTCDESTFLSAAFVLQTKDTEGNVHTQETSLVVHRRIRPSDVGFLRSAGIDAAKISAPPAEF